MKMLYSKGGSMQIVFIGFVVYFGLKWIDSVILGFFTAPIESINCVLGVVISLIGLMIANCIKTKN